MCLVIFPEWKLILLEMVIRPWIGLLYYFGIQVPNVGFNDLSPTTGDHQAQISRLFPNSNRSWVANFGAPVRLIVRVNMTPTLNKRFVSWSKKICRGRCLKRGQFLRWKTSQYQRTLGEKSFSPRRCPDDLWKFCYSHPQRCDTQSRFQATEQKPSKEGLNVGVLVFLDR